MRSRALDISVVEELASPLSQPSPDVEVTAPSLIEACGSLDTLATDRALSAYSLLGTRFVEFPSLSRRATKNVGFAFCYVWLNIT